MVAPIRDSGNKFFSKSATTTTKKMSIARFESMDVDDVHGGSLDNYDDVRGLTKHPANPSSSDIMSVTNGSVDYPGQMERNNTFDDEDVEPVDRSQLSYATNNKEIQSSRAAELSTNTVLQRVNNEEPTHSAHEDNNMFNIQLNYDVNQARDPESWDGNFQAISLHGSLEHLASDMKNIKESLTRMRKYILGKTIEGGEANRVKDLEGVGKAAWGFISSLYEAHWDSLIVDESNTSFRNMVKSKFSPQVTRTPTNGKGKNTVKLATISSIPPPIPAKSPKEVNEIPKYFKKKPVSQQKKSYTQASSSTNVSNIARDTLKIKETFPNL